MKRFACMLLIAALFFLFGCGQGNGTAGASKEYGDDYAQRVADAWKEKGYLDEMARYSDTDLLDYYGIDLSACKCGAGFSDAVGYTTEAVVVVADGDVADGIESLLNEHVASMKEVFRSYDPEAYKIAENAVMLREGQLIVMIVSPDAQAMLDTLRTVAP